MKPPKSLVIKTFTLLLIGILAGAPSFMIVSYSGIAPSDDLEKADNQSSDTQYNGPLGLDRPDQQNYAIDKELQADMGASALADMLGHTTDLGWRVADFKAVKTQFHTDSSEGIELSYRIEGNVLIVTATVCSYSVVTYEFEEGFFDVVHIGNAGLSNVHGEPNLPYRKVLLTIPDETSVLDIESRIELSEEISDFAVAPGPVPLEVSRSLPVDTRPWFNPTSYFLDEYTPSELVESTVVGVSGNQGLQLTLHPIQYNPVRQDAKFILRMTIEIAFNSPIAEEVLRSPAEYNF
ncbi:MAG: C25 family peptidase propeptide domain-containing protein, partial [Promethearchaeota archaeon]